MTEITVSAEAAPPDTTPLSMDDAMGLLTGVEPAGDDDEAADGAADTDTSPEEEDDSEGDATLDGDVDEEEDDEGDVEPETPAIEPPASWSREEQEAFSKLPPEVQATLARRESDREKAFGRKAEQLAADRKAADARIADMQAQYEQALSYFSQGIDTAEAEPDWARLAEDDPFGYIEKRAKWDAKQTKLANLRVEQERMTAHRQAQAAEEFQTYRSQQAEKLVSIIPEYNNQKVVAKERDGLVKHATETLGYAQEELAALLWDARAVKVLRDSYLLSRAKSVRAAATPTNPSVQRPSSTRPDRSNAKVESIAKRFEKSGSLEDALALYSNTKSSRR